MNQVRHGDDERDEDEHQGVWPLVLVVSGASAKIQFQVEATYALLRFKV